MISFATSASRHALIAFLLGSAPPPTNAPLNLTLPQLIAPAATGPQDGVATVANVGVWAAEFAVTGFDAEIRTTDTVPVVVFARQAVTHSTTIAANPAIDLTGKSLVLRVWAKNGTAETLAESAAFGPIAAAGDIPIAALAWSNTAASVPSGWTQLLSPGGLFVTGAQFPNVAGAEGATAGFEGTSLGTSQTDTRTNSSDSRLLARLGTNADPSQLRLTIAGLQSGAVYRLYGGAKANTTLSPQFAVRNTGGTVLHSVAATSISNTQILDAAGAVSSVAAWQSASQWGGTFVEITAPSDGIIRIARNTPAAMNYCCFALTRKRTSAGPVGIPLTFEGLPKFTNIATASALNSAIASRTPGEVITLTAVVAPFVLNAAGIRRPPFCSVVLPAGQVTAINCGTGALYLEVLGGTTSRDVVTGDTSSTGMYGIDLGSSSFFSYRGGVLGQSSNCVASTAGATDFEITDCIMEWARADGMQLVRCKRFLIRNIFGRDTAIPRKKLLWYTNGTPPQDGVADSSNGTTSFYFDGTHNDLMQIRNDTGFADQTSDYALLYNDLWMLGAALVNFGNANNVGRLALRGIVAWNDVKSADNGCIDVRGEHMEVRDNIVGPHPLRDPDTPGNVYIGIIQNPGGAPVRGGRNTLLAGAVAVNAGGVDLAGSTITGSVVDPPQLPNLRRLPWAPAVLRPAYTPWSAAPEVVTAPTLRHTDASGGGTSAPVGTWLTAGLGNVKGNGSETYQVRWLRDGVVFRTGPAVSGPADRIYQIQAGDINVTMEIQYSNVNGTGAWRPTRPISAV